MLTREKKIILFNIFREKKALADKVSHNEGELIDHEIKTGLETNIILKERMHSFTGFAKRKIRQQSERLKRYSVINIAREMELPRQNVVYYWAVFRNQL